MKRDPTFRAESIPCPCYKKTEQVWDDFVAWWQWRWPGRLLPATHGLHNLRELTGLSDYSLYTFLAERTPKRLVPAIILPPRFSAVKRD